MRLNKSRDSLKEIAAAAASEIEIAPPAPIEKDEDEELFQATALEPIREEEEVAKPIKSLSAIVMMIWSPPCPASNK